MRLSRWPPLWKTQAVFQLANFLLEQFDGHCLIANLGLEILNEIIALIRIAHLDSTLSASKKIIAPLGELRWRDGELSTERIEGLPAQDSQNDIPLATARPASLNDADGTRRSGRASPSLRCGCVIQRKTRFLHVRHYLQISQIGVSTNRAPDHFFSVAHRLVIIALS